MQAGYDENGNRCRIFRSTDWTINDVYGCPEAIDEGFTSYDVESMAYDAEDRLIQHVIHDTEHKIVGTDGNGDPILADPPLVDPDRITIDYLYNGDGDRIAQTITYPEHIPDPIDPTINTTTLHTETTQYLIEPFGLTQVLSEFDPASGAATNYLHGLDTIGAQVIDAQGAAEWQFYTTDYLGSIRGIYDENAENTRTSIYSPYGVPTHFGTGSSSLGYTGEMTDANGLVYLRARYYDPASRLFLSRDPMQGAYRTLPQSWYPYRYAHGNPTSYTDPSGECIWDACILEGSAILIAGAAISAAIYGGVDAHMQWNAYQQCPECAPSGTRVANNYWKHLGIGIARGGATGGGIALGLSLLVPAYPLIAGGLLLLGGYGFVSEVGQAITYWNASDPYERYLRNSALVGIGFEAVEFGVDSTIFRMGMRSRTYSGEFSLANKRSWYADDWLQPIIKGSKNEPSKLSIDIPSGISPEQAIVILHKKIRDSVPQAARPIVNEQEAKLVVSILETDERWYVGINRAWDDVIAQRTHRKSLRNFIRENGDPGWASGHAETNALVVYSANDGPHVNMANLYVSEAPCTLCINNGDGGTVASNFTGDIRTGMIRTGRFGQLNVHFNRPPNSRFGTDSVTIIP